jgi:circadian clock protein KaiC
MGDGLSIIERLEKDLRKCPTGIEGLDEITGGGLPCGRATLVCGGAGCGKTLVAMEFLVQGATKYDEPGVLMAFEETAEDLTQNVASLGFDLTDLIARRRIVMDHVRVERGEFDETGAFDLEGLFIRLGHAIDTIGAKRVVLDTPESLFGGISNDAILRAELRRLFLWLKDRGITTVITGERGESSLTRQGLEEYVSDCVILLDHRVRGQVSTRRLRVVKYRGSGHGTNEYPFLIDENGITVLPITSLGLDHPASGERVSTGVARLDAMLEGNGFFRGSSILVTGTAGTGKTTLTGHYVDAACRRGETCIFFAFEESRDQIIRNLRSVGIDLAPWIECGRLRFFAARPTIYGLETHLAMMYRQIREIDPANVIIDPISNFMSVGSGEDVLAMLMRLVDYLKGRQITAFFTHLNSAGQNLESTEFGISSIMDTWLLLRDIESGRRRERGLYILKSRGMDHSRQVRKFLLTNHGIELVDEDEDTPKELAAGSAPRKRREAGSDSNLARRGLEARIAALQAELAAIEGA